MILTKIQIDRIYATKIDVINQLICKKDGRRKYILADYRKQRAQIA